MIVQYRPIASGVKKSKNIHLSHGQVHQNFNLSCYQITCPCQGKDKQALNFLLVRRTLGENICLSCLKFNLSRASGQVIFLPLSLLYIKIRVPFQAIFKDFSQKPLPIS